MSKETIQKITQAEAQAKEILDAAHQRARALYAETEQKSIEDREQLEQITEQELRRKLEEMRIRSEELLQKGMETAQRDAKIMNKMAELHMEEAVKAIVWGITEQCQ